MNRIKAAWQAFWHPEIVATIDGVSGAFTRNFFIAMAGQEIMKARLGRQRLSLAFIDMDNFKNINDSEGHTAGDELLRCLVEKLRKGMREYDLVGRWGGDEFVILLPLDYNTANERIDRIWRTFPNFSWGIAQWEIGDDLKSLIKKADALMYRQKKGKKDLLKKPGL
jgi:PleD family two-component response regulator